MLEDSKLKQVKVLQHTLTTENTVNLQAATIKSKLLNLSGELRSLLNVIIKRTMSLLNIVVTSNICIEADEIVPDLNNILTASENMVALINDILEKRLAETTNNINVEKLMSEIRHDLRTPVNAILGYSEMLLEDVEDCSISILPAIELKEIINSGHKLLDLIDLIGHNKTVKSKEITSNKQPAKNQINNYQKFDNISSNEELLNGRLLVVDDKLSNRELLSRQLHRYGFDVDIAESGEQALEMIYSHSYDLILLDIIMPGLNGYEVLAKIQKDDKLKHIPVIMISALDEIDTVIYCIEMGARDYLQKPFNPVLLKAKINGNLERKRLRDRELAFTKQLQQEQEKSEKLLLNILPAPIAERLKAGENVIVDNFPDVTILFADLVQFTKLASQISPAELLSKLNDIFLAFDTLLDSYKLEKIKTIGDAYMLVGGLLIKHKNHAAAVANMAVDMIDAINHLNKKNNTNLNIRIGIHSGEVVAGIIGKNKFNYDLWGDSVNVASRMESQSIAGNIQISEQTYNRVKYTNEFIFTKREKLNIKGKGKMQTYFLKGKK
jgi:class 3 adenylate cyclase